MTSHDAFVVDTVPAQQVDLVGRDLRRSVDARRRRDVGLLGYEDGQRQLRDFADRAKALEYRVTSLELALSNKARMPKPRY